MLEEHCFKLTSVNAWPYEVWQRTTWSVLSYSGIRQFVHDPLKYFRRSVCIAYSFI